MQWTTIFAGLPEDKDCWTMVVLLRYLLLMTGADTVTGLYITHVVEQSETFVLPRSGYRRWYCRSMLGLGRILGVLILILAGAAVLVSRGSIATVLISVAVFGLNIFVVANIQMFITVLSGQVATGYAICLFLQLLSVFFSEQLPKFGKLFLIGNWGMALRSTLADPNGIPIGAVIGMESMVLIMLWIFGWRIIRRNKRGAI